MSIAHIASTGAQSTDDSNATTSSINSTGADFAVIVGADYVNRHSTPTDSKSNTYTDLTAQNSITRGVRIHYSANPTVGSGHNATVATSTGYPAASLHTYSGVKLASPFDQQNGATNDGVGLTTISTGSVTPSEDNELVIAAHCYSSAGSTVPANYTQRYSGAADAHSVGLQVVDWIQTTATATNPTMTNTPSSSQLAAAIATFKAAAATIVHRLTMMGCGV